MSAFQGRYAGRAAIGERGRVWVAERFDAATIARATLSLYAEVTRARPV